MNLFKLFLAFIPITLVLDRLDNMPPPVVFFSAALAIIPIARLIVLGTEQLARRTGDAIGGLLNATFGNVPELIIATVALKAGLYDMVRASLIGAVLANLLLAQGLAFLAGGVHFHEQTYNPHATRAYGSMMLIAVISMLVPSAFSRLYSPVGTLPAEQSLNLTLAVVLLAVYGLYLVFMLKTHPDLFVGTGEDAGAELDAPMPVLKAVGILVLGSGLAAWMSEILVGAAEGTGHALGMSQTFIGIVFLAMVGGAAEGASAVAMARKNKMDLSVGIVLGSCIQIALFVAPMLVIASYWIGPQVLELSFGRPELGALLMAVLIGVVIAGDGRANWFKGAQLISIYVLMALLFYFMPDGVLPHITSATVPSFEGGNPP